jgi:hypothetical protein
VSFVLDARALAVVAFPLLVTAAVAQPASGSRELVGDWMGAWKSATGSSGTPRARQLAAMGRAPGIVGAWRASSTV